MTVVTRMLMSRAAGTLRAHRATVRSSPNQNTKWAGVVGKTNVDGHRVLGGRPGRLDDDAGVDEADEQDEQADPDADRPLERHRDGAHDRFAQADEDEQRDDEAFEDDDAHRAGRGQALGQDEPEGDRAVDAEAGGQGDRRVGDDAHRDGQRARRRAPSLRPRPG